MGENEYVHTLEHYLLTVVFRQVGQAVWDRCGELREYLVCHAPQARSKAVVRFETAVSDGRTSQTAFSHLLGCPGGSIERPTKAI